MNSHIKETVSHTWTIENFESQGSWLECPTFSSSTNESKFSFSLCTNNQSEKAFLYVEFLYNTVPSYYKFRVSILGECEEKLFSKEYHWRMCPFEPMCRYNIANFMFKSHISKFLINCSLNLLLEVDILDGPNDYENIENNNDKILPQDDLSMDYQSLHESDVSFVVRGKEFKAHKNILAAQSSVFKAMFCADLEEKKQNRVEITDIDVDLFEHLLSYIYSGKIPDLAELGLDLFVAADKYQLDDLKCICEHSLRTSLTIESVCNVLVIADMHNADSLKAECIELITDNFAQVMATDDWKWVKSKPDLLLALLENMSAKLNHT